ncbi:unnamed protein product [Lactuca saligna]|uniref:Transmembrane protein n=1 Tax=Lactuca saligna TaxID=75948 RepID=A0AA35V6S8_LACSI|nr:unnamed protein product [Lactuca saligna]
MTAMTQSHQFLLPNSFIFDPISPKNSLSLKTCCPYVHPNRFHSHKPIITCARSSNKGLFGSQRSRKTLIQFVRFAASNLHYVLPEPLNSVMREFGGGSGSGGSGGSWKGFGWGGFDGGGGRKRRVNRKSQFWFWGFATFCCLGFWALILGGELELKSDVLLVVLLLWVCHYTRKMNCRGLLKVLRQWGFQEDDKEVVELYEDQVKMLLSHIL